MIISLGGPLPARSCSLPEAQRRRAASRKQTRRLASFTPAWPCSRWGLPGRGITTVAGGLLHHRFTLASVGTAQCTAPTRRRYVSVARSGRLLHPGCYPASRSTECGLSSTRPKPSRDHPTSLRAYIIHLRVGDVNLSCKSGAFDFLCVRRLGLYLTFSTNS